MERGLGIRGFSFIVSAMTGFAEDNTPAYEAPMTKAQFLRWVQGRDGRFELKNGRVVMQAGGTKPRGWICVNFIPALNNLLSPAEWATGNTDIAVEVGDEVRYPDVPVERCRDDGLALSTDRPVVLVEIFSPSSVATDMNLKLAEYTSPPSLGAYIVASQDEPICRVWQRTGDTRASPDRPEEIKGRAAATDIPALAVPLPLAQVYRGVGTA